MRKLKIFESYVDSRGVILNEIGVNFVKIFFCLF